MTAKLKQPNVTHVPIGSTVRLTSRGEWDVFKGKKGILRAGNVVAVKSCGEILPLKRMPGEYEPI